MSALRLSVIMPVYNVAPFLPRCLESLIAQTLSPDEIIAVDDGSSDECPAILADYARRMRNLRVVRRPNGGLSAARNTGLEHAAGKYVAFLDSDDFAEPELYATLVAMAEADALDMALCNALYYFEERKPESPVYTDVPASGVVPGAQWLKERLLAKRFLHMVWMHLYRRDFLERLQLRFVPGMVHEDVIWTTRALLAAERVRYTPEALVRYRIPQRRFSVAQNQARLERIVASSEFNARTLAGIAGEQAKDPALRSALGWQLVDGGFSLFHKLEQMPDASARKKHLSRLRKDGWFGLLWRHASGLAQRRRIIRLYLRALFPAR
ncbi:MAG: glycosyltransferase [Betaproteobacteria bacterium]|nr:glycosyltransferase [Betaproteobacteria bacterium]